MNHLVCATFSKKNKKGARIKCIRSIQYSSYFLSYHDESKISEGIKNEINENIFCELIVKSTAIISSVVSFFEINYRYTPFGGIATMIVPQLNYNANSLYLWNRNRFEYPVHSFIGHKDAILDFGWKNISSYDHQDSSSRYELVRL